MSDKKNEELEIKTKDELDDMSHDEFDVDEGANFKVEEKDQDHTQQENHYSPLQDDQGEWQTCNAKCHTSKLE
jgi:cell envelope opacity-associated protein A